LGDNRKSLQVGGSLQGTIPSVIVAALRLSSWWNKCRRTRL